MSTHFCRACGAGPDGMAETLAALRLSPLSKAPFQAPTDRDMLPSERRLFVQTHHADGLVAILLPGLAVGTH